MRRGPSPQLARHFRSGNRKGNPRPDEVLPHVLAVPTSGIPAGIIRRSTRQGVSLLPPKLPIPHNRPKIRNGQLIRRKTFSHEAMIEEFPFPLVVHPLRLGRILVLNPFWRGKRSPPAALKLPFCIYISSV